MSQLGQELRPDLSAAESEHEFNVQPLVTPGEATSADDRRFPRMPFRACVQAVVFCPPGENGDGNNSGNEAGFRCQMLTRDISRGGINLLHKQQLYPGQKIDISLPDGQERRLEVLWCRRLGVGCYSAGCRFVRA